MATLALDDDGCGVEYGPSITSFQNTLTVSYNIIVKTACYPGVRCSGQALYTIIGDACASPLASQLTRAMIAGTPADAPASTQKVERRALSETAQTSNAVATVVIIIILAVVLLLGLGGIYVLYIHVERSRIVSEMKAKRRASKRKIVYNPYD